MRGVHELCVVLASPCPSLSGFARSVAVNRGVEQPVVVTRLEKAGSGWDTIISFGKVRYSNKVARWLKSTKEKQKWVPNRNRVDVSFYRKINTIKFTQYFGYVMIKYDILTSSTSVVYCLLSIENLACKAFVELSSPSIYIWWINNSTLEITKESQHLPLSVCYCAKTEITDLIIFLSLWIL